MARARVIEVLKNTASTPIGVIWFCSMNTSMAKPAAVLAQAIRPVGRRSLRDCWRTRLRTRIESNIHTKPTAATHPTYPLRLAQDAGNLRPAQRLRFDLSSLDSGLRTVPRERRS